jgi:hypothetical protein
MGSLYIKQHKTIIKRTSWMSCGNFRVISTELWMLEHTKRNKQAKGTDQHTLPKKIWKVIK